MQKRINEAFCDLQTCIHSLMIRMNDLVQDLLRGVKLGWIAKPLYYVFSAIQVI